MASLTPEEVEKKRAVLLAEERRLAASLSAVRTQLNELVPISSLPVEVLECIFSICASWLYELKKPRYRLAWTQVHRMWRYVALDSPRLWRSIDLCRPEYAREFLLRSKCAPISIMSASPVRSFTEALHPHAERLQTIDVFLFPDDIEALFTSIGPSTSALSSLALKLPPVSLNMRLERAFPHVRRLSLTAVAIQWESCHSLTRLHLQSLSEQFAPSFSQLLAICSRSPQLEYIHLEHVDPPDLGDDSDDPNPISLPCLRTLAISANPQVVFKILAALSLPSSAHLTICYPSNTCADLLSVFPHDTPYSQTMTTSINTLRLSRQTAHLLKAGAKAWSDDPADSVITINAPGIASYAPASLHAVVHPLAITTLELCADVLVEVSSDALRDFLRAVRNLEVLRVASNAIERLLDALSTPISPSQEPKVMCPRLHTVSLGTRGKTWWKYYEKSFQATFDWIVERHRLRVPLGLLEFHGCQDVTVENVETLKEYVGGVDVVTGTDSLSLREMWLELERRAPGFANDVL